MKSLIPSWIREPTLPITITVIGAGGTGSLLLTHLARIAYSIFHLQGKRMMVTVVDGDRVSLHNVGRQAFYDNEVSLYKSEVLTAKINRLYGSTWLADRTFFNYSKTVNKKHASVQYSSNIIISCTDTVASRKEIARFVKDNDTLKSPEWKPLFWMDIGNTKSTGNIIIGSKQMGWPSVIDLYGKKMKENPAKDGCSLAMSLNEQDMFINSFCANIAAKWLWECLSQKEIDWRGAFVNLDSLTMQKIRI